ncbi:LysR family transcriptional regulator [Aestuariibacter salexigens]|uniref:LysR family transcriptional regulator n=1 Tax=Aestuariibacter salexigens TaxID=226010 RepID=UPI0003F9F7D4|nr:LysR family transcriptional regulator [Aestuariibacter salexigens]
MLKATLEQWRMFKAVVDAGGFNQAAEVVHKSQSSIHHAVNKLERSLGVSLLTLEGRRVKLTGAGEMMLRRAAYLLEEAERVEQVAHSLGQGTETQLRIAVDEVFPPSMLYSVLDATSKEYPLLRIELMESVLSGANALLDDNKVDIAISPFSYPSGFSEDLCNIEFIAVSHPDHPLQSMGDGLDMEDLKQHRQIVVRDSALRNKMDAGWLGAYQRWTVSHLRTSIDMIVNGLGFAWLPVSTIGEFLTSGQLIPIPLAQGAVRNATLYLNFKDGDLLGPAARAFIGELRLQTLQIESADCYICSK